LFYTTQSANAQNNPNVSRDEGNFGAVLSISNPTNSAVTLIWVDHNGQNQPMGAIPAQNKVEMETTPGHLFLFRLITGQNLQYRATAHRQQIVDLAQLAAAVQQPVRPNPMPVQPVAAPAPAAGGVSVSKLTAAERQSALNLHNQVRAEVGVGQLTWSEQLAGVAQQWADHIAASGRMQHRPRSGAGASQFGENLAMGFDSSGGYTVISGINSWYQEKAAFRPGQTVSNGNLQAVGHYTQMVWKGSTQVGMGKAIIQTGPQRGWLIVVANYNPPGNFLGQAPY